MKIKNILLTGVAALSLASCNDFLDIDAPSAYTEEFVFSQKSEVQRALYGVYAQALVNNLYGNAYQRTFILNSDVDIMISSNKAHAHNSYSRFDCDDQGSEIYSFWTAAYNLIEYANKFVKSAEASEIYSPEDNELMQWIGEVKCLRAMAYHDLVVMFGDVPFTFDPATEHGTDFVIPIADREDIQKTLIKDLQKAAPYMSSTKDVTVEHCSKEFAHALIARIALTAGGYSLRPDKENPRSYGTMKRPENWEDYYVIARDYADSVITAGTHSLSKSYQDVFVDECNYIIGNSDDDPIFEIPFAKESTGNTGYIQGPTYEANEGKTVGKWGETSGNGRLNAFYRFLFRDNDKRREFVNGLWSYTVKKDDQTGQLKDSIVIRKDYSVHNNKWSKLWTDESKALGDITTGSTGINYPYMRYADVLLMYAEAANEIEGKPTDEAIKYLKQVHDRAFGAGVDDAFIDEAKGSYDAFKKAVLDERKWEFAGENSRWRDLVRTNTYAEEVMYSFLRYYSVGMMAAQGLTGYEDYINEHDGLNYVDKLANTTIYFHQYQIEEPNLVGLRLYGKQLYGYLVDGTEVVQKYPNQTLPSLRIWNAYGNVYGSVSKPQTTQITQGGFTTALAWEQAAFYDWGDNNTGILKDQCKYSFYGFIRSDTNGSIWLIRNGASEQFPSTPPSADQLPVVRYILPYPNLAIQRSAGAYKNYYGY